MIAPRLREVQRGFWQAIAEPSERSEPSPEFVAAIATGPRLGREGRIQVYAEAYFSRLRDALRQDFPISARLLGADLFSLLVRDYVRAFPSDHPSIRYLGRALSGFIDRRLRESSGLPPYLGDLARLEWAMNDVFDAEDADPIGAEDLGQIAPERWPELRFAPIPALILLESKWPLHQLCDEVDQSTLRPSPTNVRVWRDRDYQVFRASIDLREAEALRRMISHEPFAIICDSYGDLPAEEAAREASATLARWLLCGIIARAD
jgi:hypothetical protein